MSISNYLIKNKIEELELKKEIKKMKYSQTFNMKTRYDIECLNKQISALKTKMKKKGKSKLKFEIINKSKK